MKLIKCKEILCPLVGHVTSRDRHPIDLSRWITDRYLAKFYYVSTRSGKLRGLLVAVDITGTVNKRSKDDRGRRWAGRVNVVMENNIEKGKLRERHERDLEASCNF